MKTNSYQNIASFVHLDFASLANLVFEFRCFRITFRIVEAVHSNSGRKNEQKYRMNFFLMKDLNIEHFLCSVVYENILIINSALPNLPSLAWPNSAESDLTKLVTSGTTMFQERFRVL